MRNIFLIITIFLSSCFYGQSKDTLYITIEKKNQANDDTKLFQNALNQRGGKFLKILVKKGNYYIDNTLTTTRPHTSVIFNKGSIINFTNNKNTGFFVRNDNFKLYNAYIKGNGKSALDFYTGFAVLLNGVSGCDISNNTFDNVSGNGILFMPNSQQKGCSNNMIRNNKFINHIFNISKNGDESAIMLGYSGKNYMHNENLIENNTIDGNDVLKVGIGFIAHGNNNIIKNNKISNCIAYGIVSYESDTDGKTMNYTKILDNEIRNIGEIGQRITFKGMGIYLMTSNNATISKNRVYNTLRNSDKSETLAPGAISVSLSPGANVSDNYIDGSGMYGIATDYSFGSSFVNNTIQNIKKSGAYFMNINDIVVSGNIFKNINEVVIKGYFENTSLPYIIEQLRDSKYKNINTGNNFKIINNKFYSSKAILYFESSDISRKNYPINIIGNNIVENNEIIGNSKMQSDLFFIRQKKEANNNIIRANKIVN